MGRPREVPAVNHKRRWALVVALIFTALILVVLLSCAAWSCVCYRLEWVRLVTALVPAGWLRGVLLGWF